MIKILKYYHVVAIHFNLKYLFKLYMFKKIFSILFRENNVIYNLHRWCHPLLKGCSNEVILKKIDFANMDNSFDLKYNK